MDNEKEDILKYLSELHDKFLSYHNHKESSAWVAVGLFPIVIIQVLSIYLSRKLSHELTINILLTIILIISGIIVSLCYIKQQFILLKYAANVVSACRRLHIRILSSEDINIFKIKLLGNNNNFKFKNIEFKEAVERKEIPSIIIDEIKYIESEIRSPRRKLECFCYSLIWIPIVVGIVIIWWTCIVNFVCT